jgi:hypothetical protein
MPLISLLNLTPSERLLALQQDRAELFLLMGVAVGLLVLAFLLLVVVIFRRQKSRKEELFEANQPIQVPSSTKDSARFAPVQPLDLNDAEAGIPETALEAKPKPDTVEKGELAKADESASVIDADVLSDFAQTSNVETPESHSEVQANLQTEPERLSAKEDSMEFLGQPESAHSEIGQSRDESGAEPVPEMPFSETEILAQEETSNQEVLLDLAERATDGYQERGPLEQAPEQAESAPIEEAPVEESSVEIAIEMEPHQADISVEVQAQTEENLPSNESTTTESESQAEESGGKAQDAESRSETILNPDAERVSKQIDEALKGAKSPDENRRAIDAYLLELEQRKTGASGLAQANATSIESEPEQSNHVEAHALPTETIVFSVDSGSAVVALLPPPHTEQEAHSEDQESLKPAHPISQPEEPQPPVDFEVQWNEVEEESKAIRHLPAAPGDLKSFADWLKEFRKP